MSYDDIYKILVVGDPNGGKTCMTIRFTQGSFSKFTYPTIGVDLKLKNIELNGKTVKLQIWDTVGQERVFDALTNSLPNQYYRGAMGAMFVYDITSLESFVNINRWFVTVRERTDSNVEFILVGNKCDLSDQRQVPREDGERLAAQYGMQFMETSSITNENIDEAFLTLARNIFPKRNQKSIQHENEMFKPNEKDSKKSTKCGC